MTQNKNIDQDTVDGFRDEWSRFDQSDLPDEELQLLFNEYFSIFPWECINNDLIGFDLGCGTGRWAKLVAPKVGKLIRYVSSQIIALFIYFPLAKLALIFDKIGVNVNNFPLSYYKNLSFYTMRTDALDRFGNRLERRFIPVKR